MTAYRTSSRIEPNVLVRVANPKVACVLGPSQARPGAWFVRWPNGLVTTEDEDTLMRVETPSGSEAGR